MSNTLWFLIIAFAVLAFLIYAHKRRWIDLRGGGGFASLTAFHDFVPKDKQDAIEIMMEEKAGKKMEEQESGQDKGDEDKTKE